MSASPIRLGAYVFGFNNCHSNIASSPFSSGRSSTRSFTKIAMVKPSTPLHPTESHGFYNVRPLSPHFGIEALDINLNEADLANPKFISQLKQDLILHRAILFRKQSMSGQKQADISNALGTVQSTFYKHPKSPHPDIFRVSNDENEGCTSVGRSGWHLDGTFQKLPFMYQTMYFPSVAHGGDTYFIPLKELYDSFSSEEKDYYNKLWMVTGRRESPIHPLVCRHPFRPNEETMLFHCGRPFVSGWFCDGTNNVNDSRVVNGVDTSKMMHPLSIQEQLTNQIESKLDEFGIRMKWEEGDFMITDNLGLAHYASEGTQVGSDSVGLRILHRTTIVGGQETTPTKIDGRSSFTLGV